MYCTGAHVWRPQNQASWALELLSPAMGNHGIYEGVDHVDKVDTSVLGGYTRNKNLHDIDIPKTNGSSMKEGDVIRDMT